MTKFRLAVVDGETVFQWREHLLTAEDARVRLPHAQAEFPGLTVRVEALEPDETDDDGHPVTHVWTEV